MGRESESLSLSLRGNLFEVELAELCFQAGKNPATGQELGCLNLVVPFLAVGMVKLLHPEWGLAAITQEELCQMANWLKQQGKRWAGHSSDKHVQ